jgi:hypothetical protein
MKLKFYGTRGSIPVCDAGFQQFGGNTTCLQITFTDTNRIAVVTRARITEIWQRPPAIGHPAGTNRYLVLAFSLGPHSGLPAWPGDDHKQKITLLTVGRDQTITDLGDFRSPDAGGIFPVAIGSGSQFRVPANR